MSTVIHTPPDQTYSTAKPSTPKSRCSSSGNNNIPTSNRLVLLSESFHRTLIPSSVDSDQHVSPVIHAIMSLSSLPTPEALEGIVRQSVTTYPLFASTIKTNVGCKGKMYWEIPTPDELSSYDVKRHIQYSEVEVEGFDGGEEIDVGNRNCIDDAMRRYVSEHISDGFDLTIGGFTLTVITYKDARKKIMRCDLLWRIHHGIGDGVLLSKVLESLCERAEVVDGGNLKSTPKRPRKKVPKLKLLVNAVGSTLRTLTLPLSFHDKDTFLKAPKKKGVLGPNKLFGSSKVWSVARAKEAGRKFDATINDVVTAAISEAIREYNLENGCSVTRGGGRKLRVRALAVVNTRTMREMSGAIEDFKACRATNEFSYVVPRLPLGDVGVEERVGLCRDEMTYLKTTPQASVIRRLNNTVRDLFGGKAVVELNTRFVINKFHCFFSNLAGPASKLKIAGVPIERLSNFVHPMDFSLGVSIQSYNGDIIVNFSADRDMVKDPMRLGELADKAFEKICKKAAEVGGGAATGNDARV